MFSAIWGLEDEYDMTMCVVFSAIWGLEDEYDMTMCVVFSAIWGLENGYDMTMAKREARRQVLLSNVEHCCVTTLLPDGVELVEMPLRYNKYVARCDVSMSAGLHYVYTDSVMLPRVS